MNILNKIKLILNKETRINILATRGFYNWMSDKKYLKFRFKNKFGYDLNLDNPQTFNEKLQWLKLYDRNPEYTKMVDKYEAKKYVANIIGEEYIIPTLGVYDKFDDIDFDKLPNQFVIKCTHDSGGLVIVKDKSKLDKEAAKKKINKSLKRNYYYLSREWPYKNVKPRIIIEKYIPNLTYDYRLYCFNGIPKYSYVYTEKDDGINKPEPEYCNIFDINWNCMEFHQKSLPSKKKISKPKSFEKMIEISKKVSANTKFLRVDFYEVNNKILIGELTFYPGSGFSKFYPNSADEILGNLIVLENRER